MASVHVLMMSMPNDSGKDANSAFTDRDLNGNRQRKKLFILAVSCLLLMQIQLRHQNLNERPRSTPAVFNKQTHQHAAKVFIWTIV